MHSIIFFVLVSMTIFYVFVSADRTLHTAILCLIFMFSATFYGLIYHKEIKQEFLQVGQHQYTSPNLQKNK